MEAASSAEERAAALALLAAARQLALRHTLQTPPYRFNASFITGGAALDTGQGEISETWMAGQKWRWTVSLGEVSHVQMSYGRELLEDHHVAVIPMRAHMLRNETLWATRTLGPGATLRTAKVLWQSRPATCVLASDGAEGAQEAPAPQARRWNEEEYCIDNATGELMVHSVAPGTYAQFGYDAHLQFHTLQLPDRIRIYVAGTLVVDAAFRITDAGADDEASLTPAPGMSGTPRPTALGAAIRMRIDSTGGMDASVAQPVIVHAQIDSDGNVREAEMSAAANAALVPDALKQVRETNFGHTGLERQGYIEVRFLPDGTGK